MSKSKIEEWAEEICNDLGVGKVANKHVFMAVATFAIGAMGIAIVRELL